MNNFIFLQAKTGYILKSFKSLIVKQEDKNLYYKAENLKYQRSFDQV